jgi:hypothetical protein
LELFYVRAGRAVSGSPAKENLLTFLHNRGNKYSPWLRCGKKGFRTLRKFSTGPAVPCPILQESVPRGFARAVLRSERQNNAGSGPGGGLGMRHCSLGFSFMASEQRKFLETGAHTATLRLACIPEKRVKQCKDGDGLFIFKFPLTGRNLPCPQPRGGGELKVVSHQVDARFRLSKHNLEIGLNCVNHPQGFCS